MTAPPAAVATSPVICVPMGVERLALRSAVTPLVSTQREDGTWDEPYYTGTGFPGDFYINYHLYRLVFPVMALGRYVAALAREAA